jgi:hypothetical protein
MVEDRNTELVVLLNMALIPGPDDSSTADFTVKFFKRTGYVKRNLVARSRKSIPLLICGEWFQA